MNSNPIFRPSRPQICRKRCLCQGQARPGRFASLDIRHLASGQKNLRATDGSTSGRGLKQKQSEERKGTKNCLYFTPSPSLSYPCFCTFSDRVLVCFSATLRGVSGRKQYQFPAKFYSTSGQRKANLRSAGCISLSLILLHTHSKYIYQPERFVSSKSPGSSGQDGNWLTPIRTLPKGLALWTPKTGTLSAGFSHPKGQKS